MFDSGLKRTEKSSKETVEKFLDKLLKLALMGTMQAMIKLNIFISLKNPLHQ